MSKDGGNIHGVEVESEHVGYPKAPIGNRSLSPKLQKIFAILQQEAGLG